MLPPPVYTFLLANTMMLGVANNGREKLPLIYGDRSSGVGWGVG